MVRPGHQELFSNKWTRPPTLVCHLIPSPNNGQLHLLHPLAVAIDPRDKLGFVAHKLKMFLFDLLERWLKRRQLASFKTSSPLEHGVGEALCPFGSQPFLDVGTHQLMR